MVDMAAPAPRVKGERVFFMGMAVAILALVFVGFAPSFYLRGVVSAPFPLIPMTPLVVAHGVVFTAWIILFTSQASLISAGRADIHMRTGLLALPLLAAMVVLGVLSALHGVARESGPPIVPPLSWLAVPLLDVPVFTGLIAAAFLLRGRSQVHKRLMLIATIGMMSPAAGRLPVPDGVPGPMVFIGLPLIFVLALFAWDIASRGRPHAATVIGCGLLVGTQVLRIFIWETPGWVAFARWASDLVA